MAVDYRKSYRISRYFLAVAEAVTRMTPTKKDDGFVLRLGKAIDFVLCRLPNRVK